MTRITTNEFSGPTFKPQAFIQHERRESQLNIDAVNVFLESDPANAQLTHDLVTEVTMDPVLKTGSEYYDMSKDQHRRATALKIAKMAVYLEQDIKRAARNYRGGAVEKFQTSDKTPILTAQDLAIFDKRLSIISNQDPQLGTRIGVHLGLFGNCIRGNGTNEQIRYWLQEKGALFLKGIYGCFAMTELGHGSNVAQLQTRAEYNIQTDTFLINTPNLPATKWWIGGAAHSATHATVYARLIVKGKDYGVKTFVVPLRDPGTFQLLPGVFIGDIGTKMGRDGIDNGWIQFKNVVIPREFMLCRFTKVIRSEQGDDAKVWSEPTLDQISGYSALLNGRVNMVMDSFRFGAKFVTIAVRYAVGRQQFAPAGDKTGKAEETQLINYPLHQYRVLPHLAVVYLISPVAFNLMATYHSTLDQLFKASSSGDKKQLGPVSLKLKDLFIDSASLKATNTWLVATAIDELRQACGGLGYSAYNGFGKGFSDWVVQCTWEGDNSILSLTSARSILKKFTDLSKGKVQESQSFKYLSPSFVTQVLRGSKSAQIRSLEDYIEVWGIMLVKILHYCVDLVSKTKNTDSISKHLIMISRFHAFHTMLQAYYEKLKSPEDSHVSDQESQKMLWNLFRLFSLYFIDKHSGEFLQFKVFTPDQIQTIVQPQLLALLPEIRKECIALTDAFKLPDAMLNAPIGYYDGDIYNNYYAEVLKNNPPEAPGPGKPNYHEVLTTMLRRDYEPEENLAKLGK
ncbi:acyl-CoA oxidase [Lachancea thermotolerans CBS 6340]|uniref:Acyl-coenzyme A oxidase n=1 Tax=Lachancea thermotolerans (strain ATCC 56472 / CBS 6340 / NRRL Y-8284) TaxID=559295 RepID=C5DLM7_LACTC|nr:KLTH0G01914p [Lachancea thermotolerans CBS 6340]CAR24688.1 KLTH0G01914p [Lachancea thermotolerans CBS 6340]